MGNDMEVGQLTADNYWEWAIRMEGLLVYKDLGECIYRDARALHANDPQRQRDRKALVLIQSHVSSNLLPMVVIHQTAKAVWDALRVMHDNILAASKATLEDKFTSLKKENSECMEEYINRAQRIRLQLHTQTEPVSDERLQRAILRGLPQEYTYVRETLLLQSNLTLSQMSQQLRSAEDRLGSKDSSEATILKAGVRRDVSKRLWALRFRSGKYCVPEFCLLVLAFESTVVIFDHG
jgi:hypothetical protein